VLEDPRTPTFLGLTDTEWHAFGYGLKEGFRFWKRVPLAWDEARKMALLPDAEKPLSPEIIGAVVKKYHYYIIGFDLPEDLALLGCAAYLCATNMPLLVSAVVSFPGVPV
jgi:hypothetical protein